MIQKLKNIGSCNHKIFRNLIFNTAHGCAINCLKPFTAEEKDLLWCNILSQNESFSYVVLTYSTFRPYESIFSLASSDASINPLICVDAKLVRCTNVYTYEALFPIRFCSACNALGYGKCTLNTNNIGGTSKQHKKISKNKNKKMYKGMGEVLFYFAFTCSYRQLEISYVLF